MIITEHTKSGTNTRNATVTELRTMAKEGNTAAIKELIASAGGWDSLTAAQKEKVTRLLIGENVTL